jgi:hypothetical protein
MSVSYQKYGISQELVEQVKKKMKNPDIKERVKQILDGVTKADLQNPTKLKQLAAQISRATDVSVSASQAGKVIDFVIAQKIDPNSKLHLIKLWGMFR